MNTTKLKMIYQHGKYEVWEQPPQRRMISVFQLTSPVSKSKAKYNLAFPYIQYIIIKDINERNIGRCLKISFSNEPAESQGQVYFPFLPNVYNDHKICWGDMMGSKYHRKYTTLSVEQVITLFWNSGFCGGGDGLDWRGRTLLRKSELVSFDNWQKMTSEKDLEFITKIDWTKHKRPRKLLDITNNIRFYD